VIVVRLMGGLGNQMFQYAAARALADKAQCELLLDTREFSTYKLHAYGLEQFNIRARQATPSELVPWPEWRHKIFMKLPQLASSHWFIEKGLAYYADFFQSSNHIHISGYFQSEKYFTDIRAAIISDFVPSQPLDAKNLQIVLQAQAVESVMIHVRRGDYVSDSKTLSIHGVCSLAYYKESIHWMRETLNNPQFFVFSNDMAWAKTHLPLGDDAIFVEGNMSYPELDIHLMAQCKHHIIANSSFSWWGAWLANHPHQHVIAPQPWFNATHLNATDLIPESWHKKRKMP
jgi:hypothetical protein